MPRRKPKVIRHITSEADSGSESLPEVSLEPDPTNGDNFSENDVEAAEEPMEEVPEETGEEEKETNREKVEKEDASEAAAEEEKQEEEDEDEVTLVNGDGVKITTDEKGNEVLPDGTLIIQPEEVSSEADSFSGPEFKKKKTTAPSDLDGTYKCTSCHEQLNHNNIKSCAKHSLLGVLLCKSCFKYLESGTFDIDEEGSEEQCTWCGEGGKLICCDSCPKAFCRSCIKTNLGRAELSNILADEDEKWLCYVCNPAPLAELIEECETVFFHLKNSKKDVKKPKGGNKNKKKGEDGVDNIMKVMQMLGNKSSSKDLLDNLVKGRSPKGLKKTLDFFKGIKKISEDLEKQIKNQLDDEDEEEEEEDEGTAEEKSSAESEVERKKDKKKSSKAGTETEESDSEKTKKKKSKKGEESRTEDDDEEEDDKKSKQTKKSSKDKKGNKKPASTSPSEDDVPGTSSGSVKGNKSNRKGRRSLFKAQQKEKTTTSSEESDDSSEAEESDDDSDWEAESGVKERRRRGSRKGKAGGKLSAKKGKTESGSEEDSEDESDDAERKIKKKKKGKKDKGSESDSEDESDAERKKKKKKKVKKDKGSELDLEDESDNAERKKKKKKGKKDKGSDLDSEDESDDAERKKKKKKKVKKDKGSELDLEDESDNGKKKKKKGKNKNKSSDSDPEIQFPKKKKNKDADDDKGSGSDEEKSKTKKKKDQKKKTQKKGVKRSEDGDISLSSDYDVESEEESSEEESSADEIMKKIKKAKQDANKGTKENKAALESDVEDKIAERLLMEEVEEEDENSDGLESSDSDLDDAKKKRDKSNKKRDRKRKKKSSSEDDGDDKKSKKKKKKKSSSADEDDSNEDSKKKKKKKGRRKKESDDESDDSDNDGNDKDTKTKKGKKASKKKKKKHHLLEVNISGSDSDDGKKKKKTKGRRKKKKKKQVDDSDFMTSAESSSNSDSDVGKKRKGKKRGKDDSSDPEEFKDQRSYKKKKGKRRRIKEAASTGSDSGSGSDSRSEKAKKSGDESVKEASGSDEDQDTPGKKRVKIRQVLKKSKLLKTTLEAERAEKDRRARIEKRRKELYGDMTVPEKVLKQKELILEYDKKNKKALVEVDKQIVKHLKPHQVEGVQFIWEATFESLEKKDEPGGGGILAHCMGLGKTLQIITYLHTLMTNEELNVKRAIVVCPLNTVLNWVEEFNKWLSHDDSIDVYEITSVKNNESRADMLEQWHEEGGVLVMGYSMYRILALTKFKKKRLKRIFYETLVDPGPDIVVCDEGHMLKNSATAIAKALNSVKTRRRVCLTGTPLQNNLIEYHCMVDFVKPNLLGSQKEYKNRFVNPITNGQCSDSTSRDVRIMKHRAHILHDLLAGCVQRKDYSVIVKFLPPKHEYVLSIRLSPQQIKLYEVYLGQYSGMKKDEDGPATQQRSASIFADYQALMRIWTHPQVLRLNTIREENKAFNDMNTFVTSEEDSSDESIDDFLDDRDSSDIEEVKPMKLDPNNLGRSTRASRRQAAAPPPKPAPKRKQNGNKIDSDSDEDGNKTDSSLEIIKSWKTNSRALDPDDLRHSSPSPVLKPKQWYDEYFDFEKEAYKFELSGKLVLLFEILKHCETVGEKILVFSQSLLSLDLIEDFLEHLNQRAEDERDKGEQDLDKQIGGKGAWIKGEDYFRMDGSTSAAYRQRWCEVFNEEDNIRARLFLISTKAGSLGVNLVGANRVIIFDASWNPSHDTQSIFRVYRFGQNRPVFIYRFVAQGTMEEKIYERQIAKQSLSQRVVDEHQIERHFSAGQLQELYTFAPDRLDDPDRKEVPIPKLPKDHILAELLEDQKDWIVKYHEHDSLLENKIDEELSEEERKAAWEDYNREKEGRIAYFQQNSGTTAAQWMQHYGMQQHQQAGATPMMLQKLYEDGSNVLQAGQSLLGQQLGQQQYRTLSLNGYNPYGWPSSAYAAHSQAINGVTYRVPITQYDQTVLMRQYQALQQQRQRNIQMAQQQGTAGAQNVSQLLSQQRSMAANQQQQQQQASGGYNTMSNLLARMSQQQQQQQTTSASQIANAVTKPAMQVLSKKTPAEQQKQQNGSNVKK